MQNVLFENLAYTLKQNVEINKVARYTYLTNHTRARSFLITLDSVESARVNEKIKTGYVLGLEKVINCNSIEIDNLMSKLQAYTFIKSEKADVIKGRLIKTLNN